MKIVVDQDLEMRLLRSHDAEAVFALVDENRTSLSKYLPWVDGTRGPADSRDFIEKALVGYKQTQRMAMGMWLAEQLVGVIGFDIKDPFNETAEIGYWIGEPHRSKGIVTRCCRVLTRHLFDRWQAHRIEIRCAVNNQTSCAIPERLGFTREATLREAAKIQDEYFDLIVYGLLKNDAINTQ